MPPRWVLGLGTGRDRGPGQTGPRALAASGASSRAGALTQLTFRALGVPPENPGPPVRSSASSSPRGQWPRPTLPAHGLERRGEGKGSWRAGLAGALPWHSSAPGSGAGGPPATSCHHRREGSPAGLRPQVTGREALRARRGTGSGGRAGRQGSSGFGSGLAPPRCRNWGPRGKAGS